MLVGRWGAVRRDRFAAVISTRSQRKAPSLTVLAAIVPILATLSACAPSPFFQNTAQTPTQTRQASMPTQTRQASMPTQTRQAVLHLRTPPSSNVGRDSVVRKPTAVATPAQPAAPGQPSSYGVASFYTEDEWTASGEKFNTRALTAAHPTLPFGTRLRVTNVTNGRSVVVRINDRGPFIPGRVVDLSEQAAENLGMVERGIVKVKLEVVQKSPGSTGSTASAKQF
jgi:rare lipoprotein A